MQIPETSLQFLLLIRNISYSWNIQYTDKTGKTFWVQWRAVECQSTNTEWLFINKLLLNISLLPATPTTQSLFLNLLVFFLCIQLLFFSHTKVILVILYFPIAIAIRTDTVSVWKITFSVLKTNTNSDCNKHCVSVKLWNSSSSHLHDVNILCLLNSPRVLEKLETDELHWTQPAVAIQRNYIQLYQIWMFPMFYPQNISTYILIFQSCALFTMFLSCGLLNSFCISPEMRIPSSSTNEVC